MAKILIFIAGETTLHKNTKSVLELAPLQTCSQDHVTSLSTHRKSYVVWSHDVHTGVVKFSCVACKIVKSVSMTTRFERVTDEYKEKYPHMKSYAACQSRAFMTGCFSFVAGGAFIFVAQELLKSHIPYNRKHILLAPIAVGTIAAYAVTRHNTRLCQQMWLAMEEKHSEVTPLEERLQEKNQTMTESPKPV